MTNVQSVGGAGSAGEGYVNGGLVIGHWSFRLRDGVIFGEFLCSQLKLAAERAVITPDRTLSSLTAQSPCL